MNHPTSKSTGRLTAAGDLHVMWEKGEYNEVG